MNYLGQITVTATSGEQKIADFNLEDKQDAIWLRATQIQPSTNWAFAYGLVYWKSSNGRELGTVKCYSHTESEIFLLTEHRVPSSLEGALYFMPRAYNRLWINAHKDEVWKLDFSAEAGKATPPGGLGVISNSFAFEDGGQIPLVRKGDAVILGG